MKIFYVYEIQEKNGDTWVTRYVGKGHRLGSYNRVDHYTKGHARRRQGDHHVFASLDDLDARGIEYRVEIIREFSGYSRAEQDSLDYEDARIVELGRDTLWNRADGGLQGRTLRTAAKLAQSISKIGIPQERRTEESRQKMSDAHSGKALTDGHRKNISEGLKKSSEKLHEGRLIVFTAHEAQDQRTDPRGGKNRILDDSQEREFVESHNGTHTAAELRDELTAILRKPVSLSATYSFINRWGGVAKRSLPKIDMTSDEEHRFKIKKISVRQRNKAIQRLREKITRFEREAVGMEIHTLPGLKRSLANMEKLLEKELPFQVADKRPWGPNRTVYAVCGTSCSGKSWVCNQLSGYAYVSYDKFRGGLRRYKALKDASYQNLPIVYDPLRNPLILLQNKELDVKFICIVEPLDVILERAKLRGSETDPENFAKALKRIKSIARRKGTFSGTSAEVLEFLRNNVDRPSSQFSDDFMDSRLTMRGD